MRPSCMCYGISNAYKESNELPHGGSVRAPAAEVDDPADDGGRLKPNRCLGMVLGVRLWYGFFGATLETEAAFERKMDELCRELAGRAKAR